MTLSLPKVLVIDDDQLFGRGAARWLTELGYQPVLATGGEQGLVLVEAGGFDAVLLDLHMPEVNGYAIIRQLKRVGLAVPIIAMSGTNKIEDVIRVWRESASDFLRKPFRIEDLAAALDRGRHQGLAGERVRLPAQTVPHRRSGGGAG